jgi:hypothetical protein
MLITNNINIRSDLMTTTTIDFITELFFDVDNNKVTRHAILDFSHQCYYKENNHAR